MPSKEDKQFLEQVEKAHNETIARRAIANRVERVMQYILRLMTPDKRKVAFKTWVRNRCSLSPRHKIEMTSISVHSNLIVVKFFIPHYQLACGLRIVSFPDKENLHATLEDEGPCGHDRKIAEIKDQHYLPAIFDALGEGLKKRVLPVVA